MDAEQQQKWDAWCDARISRRLETTRAAIADVFNETRDAHDQAIAVLRREITELRNSPPLFSAPDKALSSAMVRLGGELHAQKEGIDALRAATAECARRGDLGGVRLRLENRIAELEERGASIEKNLHAANGAIFNVSNALERVHALLARLAVASDCEHILTPIDKNLLPADEQRQPAAGVVISLPDLRLRFAESA
jgi:uncharacterized coiled-coil protein SlyX